MVLPHTARTIFPPTPPVSPRSKNPGAWIVLLTRPSYLPGVVLLAHSLRLVHSQYPLVVAVTPSLPAYAVDVLFDSGCRVKYIEPIRPKEQVTVVADRFEDTWTKLAVFGFEEYEVRMDPNVYGQRRGSLSRSGVERGGMLMMLRKEC